jgi:hypothetical protein
MEKPKIKGLKSSEYEKGRIDFFSIKINEILHKSLIALFLELGFKQDPIEDLDTIYENTELFIFGYSEGKRFYVLNSSQEDEINLILDSSIEREELMDLVEKHFQFPE